MSTNPMVPSTDWSAESKAFGDQLKRDPQVILCASCVLTLGITTPPEQVVIHDGESTCLDHLKRNPHNA